MGAEAAVLEFLERETALARELEALLRAERDAVTNFRSDEIDRCIRKKASLHRELATLTDARRQAVCELAASVGVSSAEGQLLPLLPRLPKRVATTLSGAVASLRSTLLQARRLQRVNAALIGASLKFVDQVVDACRQLMPGARYDEKATVRAGKEPGAVNRRA